MEEAFEFAVRDALAASGRKGLSFLANSAAGDVGSTVLAQRLYGI